ncbi:MAG: hypothetical protein GY803_26400, partial [Chloroflexi bacterium]|nr:hypothetical protein [Chloroflexota bacterium]
IADRYIIFLYNHDMGPVVPDTSPFSRVTASRYWMAALVASGGVMILYGLVNWVWGRLDKGYAPPDWKQVWKMTAVPLILGIPLITMTANNPTLPLKNAAQVTLAALVGLALALPPGQLAARQPAKLVWLALDGFGLMFVMTTISNLANLPRWLAVGAAQYVWMAIVSLIAGLVGLLILSGLQVWRKTAVFSPLAIFIAGLSISHLFMPLVHHLLFTDGYYYISDSDNFFSQQVWLQLITWLAAALLSFGLAQLRQRAARA